MGIPHRPWDEPAVAWNQFEGYYRATNGWTGSASASTAAVAQGRYGHIPLPDGLGYRLMRSPTSRHRLRVRQLVEDGRRPGQSRARRSARRSLAKVIGFSWWNAAFYNDPATRTPVGHEDREQPRPAGFVPLVVGDEPRVLSTALRISGRRR